MPGFDGTGPMGMGPMTGRGMGFCAVPGGWPGRSWSGPISLEEEKKLLEEAKADVDARIAEIEKELKKK